MWFCAEYVFRYFLTGFFLISYLILDVITLDILRGLQGVGAAAVVPASVSKLDFHLTVPGSLVDFQLGILANSFPPSRARSLAFASFSAGAPIGAVFGTALGGVLSEFSK